MMNTPQNNPHHSYSVGMHTVKALELTKCDKRVRLPILLHDVGKPKTKSTDEIGIDHFNGHPNMGSEMAREILKRLRFDNDTIDRVSLLVLYHDYGNAISATPAFTRRLIHRVKLENFPSLLEVKRVDVLAQSELDRDKKIEKLVSLNAAYQEVLEKGLCVSLKELAVSGSDLIQAGMKPGQELGKVLKLLLEEVLEEPTLNKKEVLIELTKRWGYI